MNTKFIPIKVIGTIRSNFIYVLSFVRTILVVNLYEPDIMEISNHNITKHFEYYFN